MRAWGNKIKNNCEQLANSTPQSLLITTFAGNWIEVENEGDSIAMPNQIGRGEEPPFPHSFQKGRCSLELISNERCIFEEKRNY